MITKEDYNLVVDIHESKTYFAIYLENQYGEIQGSIEAEEEYPFVFFVVYVSAPHGYGPILYDKALEVAAHLNSSLTAGRIVSSEAANVWKFYLVNRPDIQRSPLVNIDQGDLKLRKKIWKELEMEGDNPFLYQFYSNKET